MQKRYDPEPPQIEIDTRGYAFRGPGRNAIGSGAADFTRKPERRSDLSWPLSTPDTNRQESIPIAR